MQGGTNKITADVREAILKAFDLAGGVEYLCAVAREDPKALGDIGPGNGAEQEWQELPRPPGE
jgi:hypothetical protein